jgi:hypothetical protein
MQRFCNIPYVLLETLLVAQLLKNFPPFWNPKFSYCVHKRQPLNTILRQLNLVHKTYYFVNSLILILSSYICLLLLWVISSLHVSRLKCKHFTFFHACYIPHRSHPLLCHHPNILWWEVQVMKLFNFPVSTPSFSELFLSFGISN